MYKPTLQSELKFALDRFLSEQFEQFPREDLLKIDLHCHDCNSDAPDELIGRILNVPETWIDALTAAGFSCWVPDFNIGIHALTFGFTAQQEKQLSKLRENV